MSPSPLGVKRYNLASFYNEQARLLLYNSLHDPCEFFLMDKETFQDNKIFFYYDLMKT